MRDYNVEAEPVVEVLDYLVEQGYRITHDREHMDVYRFWLSLFHCVEIKNLGTMTTIDYPTYKVQWEGVVYDPQDITDIMDKHKADRDYTYLGKRSGSTSYMFIVNKDDAEIIKSILDTIKGKAMTTYDCFNPVGRRDPAKTTIHKVASLFNDPKIENTYCDIGIHVYKISDDTSEVILYFYPSDGKLFHVKAEPDVVKRVASILEKDKEKARN